jgi:hypothetical protein
MKDIIPLLVATILMISCKEETTITPIKNVPLTYLGIYTVDSAYTSTTDSRDRSMNLKIYFPKNVSTAVPLIIVVHGGKGGGNNIETLRYIGYALASHGYVTVHGQYTYSDDIEIAANKPNDAKKLIDNLLNGSITINGFSGTIDATKVAECGHSGGAYTGLALAGTKHIINGSIITYKDARVKCVFVFSPNGTNRPVWNYYLNSAIDNSWGVISVPTFIAFGALEGNADAGRGQAYDNMPIGNKYEAIIPGVDHDNWNGKRPGDSYTPADSAAENYGKSNAVAFFNYYLLNTGVKDSIGLYGNVKDVVFSKK